MGKVEGKKRERKERKGEKNVEKKRKEKKKRRGKDETDKNTRAADLFAHSPSSRLDLGTDSAPFLAAPLVSIRLTVIKEEPSSLFPRRALGSERGAKIYPSFPNFFN